jgi:DNA-binding response OmpR family regulator
MMSEPQARANVELAVQQLAIAICDNDRLKALEAENEGLREQLARLKSALTYDGAWMAFPLTRSEEVVLRTLYRRPMVSHDQLHAALYAARPDCDQPESENIVAVVISNIRRKFPMITIENVRGRGYRLPEASREWIKARIADAA